MNLRRAFAVLLLAGAGAAQDQELREAARLDGEGKCRDAETVYQRLLSGGTPSPALLNNLGNHYLACGDPGKAKQYFEQLHRANPSHRNANLQLARMAADDKRGAEALEYLGRVRDDSPPVRLLRAEALHWAGNKVEASAVLQSIEQQARGEPRVLFTLGVTCARLGLYEQAEKAFHAVLVTHPGDFTVLFNLGRAAARAGHHERAESALETALKIRPEDADALLELGLVHAARRDYSRAVYFLARARQRAPSRPDITLALARAAEDAGFFGDSALAYDEYLRLRPDDDAARRDRARVCGYTDTRVEEGLAELHAYIKRHARDPLGHYYLAQLTWRDEPEQSLALLTEALRLDPKLASARVSLAWLLHRMGRTEESVPHLQAALAEAPDDVRALDQLGLAFLTLDQPAEAEKVLRRAWKLAPEDPEVLLHLGRTAMALGQDAEAEHLLATYRKVRPAQYRVPRKEPGMIESATLSVEERRKREVQRFRQMSASRPDDPKLQLHLAGLLLESGQAEDAAAEYRKLRSLNADAAIWEEAGRALARAEQYELAREFLEPAAKQRASARLDLAIALFFTAGAQAALEAIDGVPEEQQTGDFLLMKARILDAAGRPAEAAKILIEGLGQSISRPTVVEQAALLLLRQGRKADALRLVAEASGKSAGDAGLLLTHAVTLALMGRTDEAEKALRRLQSRWPEWERPYVVHGLLLEDLNRTADARRKLQTAAALGARDPDTRCGLARLSGVPAADPDCACRRGLATLLPLSCGSR